MHSDFAPGTMELFQIVLNDGAVSNSVESGGFRHNLSTTDETSSRVMFIEMWKDIRTATGSSYVPQQVNQKRLPRTFNRIYFDHRFLLSNRGGRLLF